MYIKTAKPAADVPTTELFVPQVMDRIGCVEHDTIPGVPCYWFQSLISDKWIEAVCNRRARRAGMTAPIRPASLDRSLAGKPSGSWDSRR